VNKKAKRFDKIIDGKQKEYVFTDIKNFLGFYGFEAEMSGSSHCIFRKKPFPHITIVVHNHRVKGYYVKRAVQILKSHQII